MKKLCLITVLILLSVALCACSFDESENSFRGGELLDNNKMSEIKESLFTQESENAEESEVNTETVDEKETGKETVRPSENETDDQSEYVEAPVESENETDIVTEENGVVYWTKGGSVWHVSKECYHIKKSNNVESGSVEDALEAGKEKVCSYCGK